MIALFAKTCRLPTVQNDQFTFASDVCKTSLSQYIDFLILSKVRDLKTTKNAFPDFVRPQNMLGSSIVFHVIHRADYVNTDYFSLFTFPKIVNMLK